MRLLVDSDVNEQKQTSKCKNITAIQKNTGRYVNKYSQTTNNAAKNEQKLTWDT